MWNKSIRLVTGTDAVEDEDGFDVKTERYLEGIPANFKDATRNDVVMANQSGYSADQNVEIAGCNYNGERFLYDEATGDRYEVKRAYQKDKGMNVVLTCERRERGG
jgi:hypothetical protein